MSQMGFYLRGLTQPQANALRARLTDLAASHGYLATRGPTAGRGNLAAMLQALDAGEVATVLLSDGQRAAAIEHLGQVGEDWADVIVDSLLAALERQTEAE